MENKGIGILLSHWEQVVENPAVTPLEFYSQIVAAITARAIPNVVIATIARREGGLFSPRRTYLRVRRGRLIFDISAVVFGNTVTISWWLSEARPGLAELLGEIPVVGMSLFRLLRPATFYTVDTVTAFQHAVHNSVLEAIEAVTTSDANRRFDDNETPILDEYYAGR